jgi:hypothetical protein
MGRIRRAAAVSLLLPVAVACGSAGGDATMSVRDSAAVEIVESSGPAWSGRQGWAIDSVPSLEIGVEAGEEPYELNRAFDAMRLPDGTILVGNSGSGELRVFDAGGRYVRAIGRRGNGPGEFGEFATVRVFRTADGSLVAYDGANLRVHHFDSTGTYRETVRIESTADGLRAFFVGLFGDGSWLTLALQPELRNEPGTYLRSAQQFVRFGADGRPLTVLRRVEGRARFVNRFGSITHFPFVPFTSEPVARASGDHVYIVPSGAPELEVRDLDGALRRVIRLGLRLDRSADVFGRFRETSLAAMDSEQRPQYAHFYGLDHPLPEHVPAFQGLIMDDQANVWLERYRQPWEEDSRYEIIDRQGRWLGQVQVPAKLRIFQIGTDFVLGRQVDSLGVERVRVHALRRGGGP